jgi:DnaJ-domain-containing protein 1
MEAERLRWERHIAEKQRARVMAHRGQQKALEEEAVAKRELVNQITDRLARQVRGKTFVSVLRELGLPVAKGAKGAAVHKAYRRALSIYHPDRATRRGLSWQKVTEAEETYKLLQTQYDLYVAQQEEAQAQMYPQRRRQ